MGSHQRDNTDDLLNEPLLKNTQKFKRRIKPSSIGNTLCPCLKFLKI